MQQDNEGIMNQDLRPHRKPGQHCHLMTYSLMVRDWVLVIAADHACLCHKRPKYDCVETNLLRLIALGNETPMNSH